MTKTNKVLLAGRIHSPHQGLLKMIQRPSWRWVDLKQTTCCKGKLTATSRANSRSNTSSSSFICPIRSASWRSKKPRPRSLSIRSASQSQAIFKKSSRRTKIRSRKESSLHLMITSKKRGLSQTCSSSWRLVCPMYTSRLRRVPCLGTTNLKVKTYTNKRALTNPVRPNKTLPSKIHSTSPKRRCSAWLSISCGSQSCF